MPAASMDRFCKSVALSCVCTLLLASASPAAPAPTEARTAPVNVEKVDFERHLMGLFGRMGCNAGSCHGSFQGKGGFRVSLFGYDPEKDYFAVTREALGRRIDSTEPDRSLLLLKATGQVEHGGGVRFGKGSWQYQLFRQWIMLGSPWTKGSGEVRGIAMTPPEYAFKRAGETGQLCIKAKFADDS